MTDRPPIVTAAPGAESITRRLRSKCCSSNACNLSSNMVYSVCLVESPWYAILRSKEESILRVRVRLTTAPATLYKAFHYDIPHSNSVKKHSH